MERRQEGLVTVHFYDVRDAQAALMAIQDQHMQQQFRHYKAVSFYSMAAIAPPQETCGLMSGQVAWAQFINGVSCGNNQGTLAVRNFHPSVPASRVQEIFQAFGPVKEVRHNPNNSHQRFVEFYDVRNAAMAKSEMNGKKLYGRKLVVHFSRPGVHFRQLLNSTHENQTTPPPQSGLKKLAQPSGSRKGHGKDHNHDRNRDREHDPQFLIKEEATTELTNCRDSRTTVMIKNIPNKYSLKTLLNLLDDHCIHCNEQVANEGDQPQPSAYDFVYLPVDFYNKCNIGYAFVNMTSSQAALRLYKAFHHQDWPVLNSKKICEVTYARLQGLEALRDHFNSSNHPRDASNEFKPMVFLPPRNGRMLTEPVPIIALQPRSEEPQVEQDRVS